MNMYYNGSNPEETVKLTQSWYDLTETGYKSPITLMTRLIQSNVDDMVSDGVLKAVCDIGVSVDKDELIRALKYDREQYEKGYRDRDRDIVRCRNCEYGKVRNYGLGGKQKYRCTALEYEGYIIDHEGDWFCADGERRKEDETD